MKTYVVFPQFLVTDELVSLAKAALSSFREHTDAFLISVDDSGEYGKPAGADAALALSDVVVTNKENSGFARACNAGYKWIHDNVNEDCFVLFANNDILVHDRVLPALQEPFSMFEDVAFTGILSSRELKYDGVPLRDVNLRGMAEGGQFRDWMQDGGLVCTKKSVLEKIGPYDEQFIRGGYEDVDLFLRARDTFGMKIIMNGTAMYWHKQGATRWNCESNGIINDFGRESKSIETENLEKFIKKWGYNPHVKNPWKNTDIWNA